MKDAVALWLVRWTSDRAALVRALAGYIVLCSWAGHYSHGASLHPGCINGYRRNNAGCNPAMD